MTAQSAVRPLTLPLRITILLAALLLAITPLMAFAAPVQQDITADVVGTWESGESEDGEVVTLAFFEDGSVQGTSIYTDDETTIAYHGSWEATGEDTFIIGIEAVNGEEQAEVLELNAEITRRGLRLPESVGFESTGMNLTLLADEPTPVADVLLGADVIDEPVVVNEEFVGTWSTGDIDSAFADYESVNLTVSLFDDGTMETTANFDEGAYIGIETGTWVDEGDGTLTITYETTDGQPYNPVVPVTFEVEGDTLFSPAVSGFGEGGLLVTLTGDEPVRFESDIEEVTPDAGSALAGLYVAGPVANDDGADAGIMVYLEDGGFAQTIVMPFSATSVPVSRVGVWEEAEDGTVLVTLEEELLFDGSEEAVTEALETPEELEFTVDGDTLATEGLTLYRVDAAQDLRSGVGGESGEEAVEEVTVEEDALEAEATEEPVVEEEAVVEEPVTEEAPGTGTIPFDASGSAVYISPIAQIMEGNIVSLVLLQDGIATISVTSNSADLLVTDLGTWEQDEASGTITLTMTQDDQGAALAESSTIVYTMEGELLVSDDYDAERYGPDVTVELSN